MFENNSSHHSVCRWLAVVPSFNLVFIFSGAKFRGEFEERLKAVLKEVQDANGQIVLFIDEIHTVVGAGAAEGGWLFSLSSVCLLRIFNFNDFSSIFYIAYAMF